MEMPLRVYTPYLDLLCEIDSYSSLQLERNYHDVGDVEIHVNLHVHGADKIKKSNIITLGDSPDKAMFVRHMEIELTEEGKSSEEWTIKGPTLQGLMSQRITVPLKGSSYDRKSGSAETVMKHYVRQNFLEAVDSKRNMKELIIAPDRERGEHVSRESRYKNVADELANISKESGLGWTVYIDYTRHKFVFDVVEGKDLTQYNDEGNDPVFFSPDFGTIKSQSFSDSDLDMANFGYIAGQGEGKDRKIVEVGESTGMNRFETFVDARDVDNEDDDDKKRPDSEIEKELTERGKKKMEDMENELSLDAEILSPTTREAYQWKHDGYLQPIQPHGHYERKEQQITPFVYERDFDLGDKTPVYNRKWGVTMTARMTKIKEIHEPGGFRLDATWGKERPTLVSKIRDKFDELSGVEKQEVPAQLIKRESKITNNKLTQEQLDRIEQAKENLKASKIFTEEYAEKKRITSDSEPSDHDVIWIDNSDPDNIVWKVYENGIWREGPSGPQGIRGNDGEDGKTYYTWIKYADDKNGSGMSDYPETKKYIGISSNHEEQKESNDPNDYTWTKFKGEDGVKGDAGYLWIRYADDREGNGISSDPKGKRYIGLSPNHDDDNASDDARDYTWQVMEESEIGGTNLISHDPDNWEQGYWKSEDKGVKGESNSDVLLKGCIKINELQKYALQSFGQYGAVVKFYDKDDEYITHEKVEEEGCITFTVPEDANFFRLHISTHYTDGRKINPGQIGKELQIKLEKGEKGTDWSFAPEDSEKNIHVSNKEPLDKNKKWLDTSGSHDKWRRYNHDSKDDDDFNTRWPTTDVIDKDTTFADSWLLARHIESLNGLTVGGGQFEVDKDGNVCFAGDLTGAKGTFGDVLVDEGDITLRDKETHSEYSLVAKPNLIRDHSFELSRYDASDASTKHNWAPFSKDKDVNPHWKARGNPMIATLFEVNKDARLPIFGYQAAVVKSGDFVVQEIKRGQISGDMSLTFSAYFKRQQGKEPGRPRIEIDHLKYSDKSAPERIRLLSEEFDKVPDDYTAVRHSATFDVPDDFETFDYLELKLSGAHETEEWVQVDGVQIVEDKIPSVYQDETGVFETVNGQYNIKHKLTKLWSGAVYLKESHKPKPDKKLSECRTGWILQWQAFKPGGGEEDHNFQYTFLPKIAKDVGGSKGHRASLFRGNSQVYKYYYVHDDYLAGKDQNGEKDNRKLALTAIYEF